MCSSDLFSAAQGESSGVSPIEAIESVESVPAAAGAEPIEPANPPFPTRLTRAGDTWWSLAQEIYDDGQLFRELYRHNQGRVAQYDRIPAGTEIVCPPASVLRREPPQLAAENRSASVSGRTYRTRAGDTLFSIAREQLGQASRFGELLQENKAQLPQRVGHLSALPAGIELQLPRR